MAGGFGDLLAPVKDAVIGGGGTDIASTGAGGSSLIIGVGILLGVLIISAAGVFVWFFWSEKRKWNMVTRVHYENPTINGISFGQGIPTRRVRFKDGRVVYLYKSAIQGYTISPELLIWTRPKEHDVIVTQDKRLFCLIGIENIDVKRKVLNVDVAHPDIEMDRQDLQNHIDSKKFDDPNEKLKLIAKATMWVFLMTTIIVLAVLGSKYFMDSKELDIQRDNINLQVSQQQGEVMEAVNTFMTLIEDYNPNQKTISTVVTST